MNALHQLTRALYPDRCPGCGEFGSLLCRRCAERLPAIGDLGRCAHCRGRWAGANNCPRCFSWLSLDGTVVACEMHGVARRIVHGPKYRGVAGFAKLMAEFILAEGVVAPDAAVAVPLHPSRERQRGFNQAGRLLSALGWIPVSGELRRVKKTESQVGMRERARRRNVAGAFEYNGADLGGLSVAVVDDVITTGATVTECARTLKEHGASSVIAVAFARAHYETGSPDLIFD